MRLAHNFPYNAIHLLSTDPVPRDQWIHLLLTYDGSSQASGINLYLDAKETKLQVQRDNLYKDIVFHPRDGTKKPPVDQHLKIGARWRGKGFTGGSVDEIRVYDRELTSVEAAMLVNSNQQKPNVQANPTGVLNYQLANSDPVYNRQLKELQDLRYQQSRLVEGVFEVMVMDEMDDPRTAYVLDRGIYNERAEPVPPGTPSVILELAEDAAPDRLGLADWLFNPRNPLTARVTVNRFWQHYFGTGLVKTADDFGSQGERPTHPELLDWLASEFVDSEWDVKYLQKLLVMSATYRQSSQASPKLLEKDVGNRLLARGPSNRLSAESMRDLALTASGLLNREIGGPSVKPYQPEGLWAYNAFSGRYQQDHGDALYRRSLYTFWKRTNPPPSMNIFDAPSRSYCVVTREKTDTPLQALVLMNDPQFLEASRVLAEKIMTEEEGEVGDKIKTGFRLLTGRNPLPEEIDILTEQFSESVSAASTKQNKIVSIGEHPINNRLDYKELVAYTKVMSTVMNYDATTMKR